MSDELEDLIEQARKHVMTPEEKRAQAISFAYGNGHLEDERITREGVARAYDALKRDAEVTEVEAGQAALQERTNESVAHGKKSLPPVRRGRAPR
jgi:hypothetical protein